MGRLDQRQSLCLQYSSDLTIDFFFFFWRGGGGAGTLKLESLAGSYTQKQVKLYTYNFVLIYKSFLF